MVEELLSEGKENARTTEELVRACGFSNKRDLTIQIAKERAAGAIICSTTSENGGYYLPATRSEVEEFVNSMSNRAKNTFKAIHAAREYLKQIDGQMDMQDVDTGGDMNGAN